jgi:hypothetical protein
LWTDTNCYWQNLHNQAIANKLQGLAVNPGVGVPNTGMEVLAGPTAALAALFNQPSREQHDTQSTRVWSLRFAHMALQKAVNVTPITLKIDSHDAPEAG